MNVLIVCAVGMSSSSLCQKVRDTVQERGLNDIKVGACGSNQAQNYAKQADIVFLAPQISYLKDEIEKECFTTVYMLTPQVYGSQDSETITDWILHPELMESVKPIKHHILLKVAEMAGSNPVIRSISEGMSDLLPVTVIGALCILIEEFPIPFWQNLIEDTYAADYLTLGYDMTCGLIALYVTLTVSYHYAKKKGRSGTGIGLTAMVCLMALTNTNQNGIFDTTYLGAKGLFAAMIVAIYVVKLFTLVDNVTRFKKDTLLPKNIGESFRSILPSAACVIFTLILCYIFSFLPEGTLPGYINAIMTRYVSTIAGTSGWSQVFLTCITNILWFFGLHGGNIVGSVTSPIFTQLSFENLAAYHAGQQLPYMVIKNVALLYTFGGAGSTLALSLLMMTRAKSKKLKSLGRISFPMGIFFINEPILFGFPIVLNPLLLVPFVLVPVISVIATFTAMKIGILPFMIGVDLPWTTPMVIFGILQGSWKLGAWQIFIFVMQIGMWYPFFKMADNNELNIEQSIR